MMGERREVCTTGSRIASAIDRKREKGTKAISNTENGRRPKRYPERKENMLQENRIRGDRRGAEDAESQVNVNASQV
jgi:hypothetical protein